MHSKGAFPAEVQRFLSSPLVNEVPGRLGEEGRWRGRRGLAQSGGGGGLASGLGSEILVSCWPLRVSSFSLLSSAFGNRSWLFPPNQFRLLAYANATLNESRVCFLDLRIRTFKWDQGGDSAFLPSQAAWLPGGRQFSQILSSKF